MIFHVGLGQHVQYVFTLLLVIVRWYMYMYCIYMYIPLQVLQLAALTARKASKQRQVLKRAFSEIYLNIILLQNFQQLNHTGFRKILKKHDKLTRSTRGKDVFKDYVCQAYFWTSKCVMDMLGRVEKHMIQLEGGNRTKAMNRLRVPPLGTEHRRSQWTSYFAGLFCGMLLLSVIVVCVAFGLWPKGYDIDTPHLEPSLRGMRAGLVLSLWFFGFAVNTFGWRRAGVNNVLIFEFNPRHYLNFVELFAVCTCIIHTYMSMYNEHVHVLSAIVSGQIHVHCHIHDSVQARVGVEPWDADKDCMSIYSLHVPCAGCWYDIMHLDDRLVSGSLCSLAEHTTICGAYSDVRHAGLSPRPPTAHTTTTLQSLAPEEIGE